ncbi:MAG TPA: hypothetical protein VKB50_30115 [Vicinamibacterales bacterium]|nr:hypothetical protein [Vicinamibacterales bacterium]
MTPLVVVSSAVANKPSNGGNARMVLNWLEGLERLGVEVFFIEQIRSEHCVDDSGHRTSAGTSANRSYLERVMSTHGFASRMALVCDASDSLERATLVGATATDLYDIAEQADLLINISGHLSVAALKDRFRRKAYVDLDPGYTQIWHAEGSHAARLEGHDVFFTVGQQVGSPACGVPTDGIEWRPIRQPVLIDDCVKDSLSSCERFTTIASWRGAYAPIALQGTTYGVKAHEFRRIVDLPQMCDQTFEVALDIHPGDARDADRLRDAGWQLVDPRHVAAMPDDYCRYIDGSAAECSAAQGIYVQTASGWFSDRTARYLASGKPALVQNTGFSTPETGEGLVVFDTSAEAAEGAARIARDYRDHCEAARWLAKRYFDSETELRRFMEDAGL